jgi:DNA (cytosine-5)-methyltransferase 1
MGKLNGLDLFSGIGGISLALRSWVRAVAYCESNRYAQGVLLSRMQSGDIDQAPIWDDVRTLKGEMLPEIDIIYGGFPCQDISSAGNGKGLAGERSGLFYEIVRLAKEIKPKFIFLENVSAIRTRGLDTVTQELTEAGYDCRWGFISAADLGAPHRRERWFCLAYNANRPNDHTVRTIQDGPFAQSPGDYSVTDPNRTRLEVREPRSSDKQSSVVRSSWWITEPSVGRVVNGLPCRVDRIKCLGNAVVPEQAKEAFKRLLGVNT